MSAYAQRRSEVEAELDALARTHLSQMADAGGQMMSSGVLPDAEPFARLSQQAGTAIEDLETLRSTRERIVAIGERLAKIQQESDTLDNRQREIGGELDPHYQTIGENAFRVYRDNPLIDQEYADIFAPALEAYDDMRETRAEVSRTEAELGDKPFLEKVVLRGRLIMLKNRLASREHALGRLYRDAGKQISATDFVTSIGDPDLDAATEPFLNFMEELRTLERSISVLETERASLRSELGTLGVERRSGPRLEELDDQMAAITTTRDKALSAIAAAAAGATGIELGESARAILEEARETDRKIADARKMVARLEAAIRAERVGTDIDQIDASIRRKSAQIKTLTDEVQGLESRRATLDAERKKAEKARGSLADLLPD